MIEFYKEKQVDEILNFLNHTSHDLYITESNIRKQVKDKRTLKKLLKLASNMFLVFDKGDCQGLILQWKSIGIPDCRFYVKFAALNEKVLDQLLTNLIWSTKKDLFVKLKKTSNFNNLFRSKGFEFRGDRGEELLLVRKYKGK